MASPSKPLSFAITSSGLLDDDTRSRDASANVAGGRHVLPDGFPVTSCGAGVGGRDAPQGGREINGARRRAEA